MSRMLGLLSRRSDAIIGARRRVGASSEQVGLGKGSPSAELNLVRAIDDLRSMPSLGGIREAERLTLLRPTGGKIGQPREAEAPGECSIDRGLNDVGREER